MGCDIHGRLQVKWPRKDKWQDAGEIEDGRNYRVFAALANVRNGFGFAGVATHVPLVPIAEPRGLPADLVLDDGDSDSIVVTDWCGENPQRYWLGDHSHSWLTLDEVMAWDGWAKTLHMTGVLDREEWDRMKAAGETQPSSWWGGVSGPNVKVVDACDTGSVSDYTHVRHEWQTPFIECCPTFWKWLQYIQSKHSGQEVRLIFGFDS